MSLTDIFASDAKRCADGTGGFVVHHEMLNILSETPGYVKDDEGGQRPRDLYRAGTVHQDPRMLRRFALDCFLGQIAKVRTTVESGQAPDLTQTETPYKFGYCTLVIAGAQRVAGACPNADHAATLKYLISCGAPVDSEDIVGLTALHHATQNTSGPTLSLARLLLEAGANVNHQNRYGEIPILGTFQLNDVAAVELLMEFGADLDIRDADGTTGRCMFVNTGPQITAVVTKWLRRRNGEQKPLDEKKCAGCERTDMQLKICSRCHATKYCSSTCQRSHWRVHKQTCRPFNAVTAVTVRPTYTGLGTLMPTADFTRHAMGISTGQTPNKHLRAAHAPRVRPDQPKAMVIKVQVPYTGTAPSMGSGPMLVYDKKRDFVCRLEAAGNEEAYMRIGQTVWTQGVGGAKAYFPAELRSRDELVIKVGEVLAEQPF